VAPASADLKATVKEAMMEMRDEQKAMELSFSGCSAGTLQTYLAHLHVGVEEGVQSDLPAATVRYELFRWFQQEEADVPRASQHLQDQLTRFGVHFGRGGYKLYDVHARKQILNVEDRKTGNLKGGTDLIIGPYGLHLLGVVQQSCVAVELKTEKAVTDAGGLGSFTSQATLELIASNYYSNQMTVVLLTDLCTAATIFTLSRKPNSENMNVKAYENLSVSQALAYIADHLLSACVPDVHYQLGAAAPAVAREAVETLQVFKKARVSPLEDSVVWEHFQDMLQDCAPGTRERAEVINELYRACDFPQPAFLSMYT
jgi:hypothetical protein